MNFLGIKFAPLFVPLERRLQTLGVVHYTALFFFAGIVPMLFFIYLLFTSYYFIPLAYLIWYLYDKSTSKQGGRRSDWARRWKLFTHTANYYPVKLVKTAEMDPSKNYILALHPHGILCHSHFINFGTEGTGFSNIFPGIKPYLSVLGGGFKFPIFRDYFLLSGVVECSKESIGWVLSREGTGNAVSIIIGGAVEALEAHPKNFCLKLKSRKGFIKLALKYGASLVPVYAFGENDLYYQVPNPKGSKLRNFQNFLTQRLGFSPPLCHGRGIFNYTFGILPFRKPVNTVVGSPIEVERVEDPSPDQVEALHEKYCDALVELFEQNKTKYGVEESDHLRFE